MNLSKQSKFHVDNFTKNLKKKEQSIDLYTKEVTQHFNEMVIIKDYLGTIYNDNSIALNERTKIFLEKLKELEIIGEKHDNCVKKIKEIKEKLNLELDVLISSIDSIEHTLNHDQIRNHIFQYIESKR